MLEISFWKHNEEGKYIKLPSPDTPKPTLGYLLCVCGVPESDSSWDSASGDEALCCGPASP